MEKKKPISSIKILQKPKKKIKEKIGTEASLHLVGFSGSFEYFT